MSVKSSTLLDNDNDSIQSQQQYYYPDIVYTLEPSIQHITRFLRILLWKKGYTHQSIILTLIWTFFWFHTLIVSYTIPIWISLAIYYNLYVVDNSSAIEEKQTTMNAYEKLALELKELQFELSNILPAAEAEKDRFRRWCRSLFVLDQQRHYQYTIVVSLFVYLGWIGLLNYVGIEKIIWFLGCLILTWYSSLFKIIRYSYHRACFLLNQQSKRRARSSSSATIDDIKSTVRKRDHHFDRFYHFVVIEHQRWWLHCGWAPLLLPNERPEWSDEYLSQVPSTDKFHLPPPTTRGKTEISWEWLSSDWEIDFNHNVDKDGWEYGSWDWTSWSIKSSGLRVLTRRRHWVRNARLLEKEVVVSSAAAASKAMAMPMPIMMKKTPTSSSLSTSASSEDSFMCSTPTTSMAPPLLKSSWSTSTTSTSIVEPCFVDSSSVDQLWLRR